MLDALVIAGNFKETLSASNPLRLQLDGHVASLQVVQNALNHGGHVVPPIDGDQGAFWDSAPKLNGLYLLNALVQSGFATELINDAHLEWDQLIAFLETSPRAVVISTTFMVNREQVLTLIREIKRWCPKTTVIVGGPFVAFSYRVWQRREEALFDHNDLREDLLFYNAAGDETDLYIVSDVGETILIQALERIRDGQSLDNLPNTARPRGGGYCFSARVDDLATWRELSINWAMLPDRVFAPGVVPLRASTGCPHQCSFCNFNKDHKLLWVKPLDDLVAEMKAVQERGARYVWFSDDNFRLGRRDLDKVCERFIAEGLNLKWMTLLRAEVLQAVDLQLLRQAGCVEVQMGIESADPAILASMNKQSDPELNERVIRRLLLAGIDCSCYFVIGFPGETQDSIDRTIAFLRRLEAVDGPGILKWSLYPFVLVPGSPVFEADQRKRYGLNGYKHTWQHYTMDAKNARSALLRIFMALEKSGPVYRGDNLDLMLALPTDKAKAFVAARHALEKRALKQPIEPSMIDSAFAGIFSERK